MTALADTIAAQAELLKPVLALDLGDTLARIEPARRIWLVGTGSSQHAAELGAWMFRTGDREARWSSSATFVSRERGLESDDAVVIISHTTETAFARRARARALAAGARVVSITGRGRGWPEAVQTVEAERSETYTASYLSALIVLARLSAALGQAGFDERQLSALPARIDAAARAPVALSAPPRRLIVLAGAGPAAVTAREGAVKLREAARLPAEGFEAEYLLHGSAVPLGSDDALLAIQPGDDRFGLLGLLAGTAANEGLVVATVVEPEGLDPVLAQIPLTVRLQKLASELADARGIDADKVIVDGWEDDRLWRAGDPG
jgi:glucosamine--fructose-6-phosphate aminotransferase (isomerizing)